MTLLAEKLQQAGVDTFEARFAVLATEALRKHPHSALDAWRYMGEHFGWDYLRERMKDMQGSAKPEKSPPTPLSTKIPTVVASSPKLYQPRPKPSPERIQAREQIKAKIIEIMFGCKTGDGRDWAEVGAHEIDRFDRDGALAREIRKELPILTGNMRFANLRELISGRQFEDARKRAGL